MLSLKALRSAFPRPGRVESIWLRLWRGEDPVPSQQVRAIAGQGLEGDHYRSAGGTRQVTLIQHEHLAAVAALLGCAAVEPRAVRRNLVVSGINLLALKGARVRVGEALLELTGPCHPCSRMEENLGPGGYNAMRGHGGVTARIVESGWIRPGDALRVVSIPDPADAVDE